MEKNILIVESAGSCGTDAVCFGGYVTKRRWDRKDDGHFSKVKLPKTLTACTLLLFGEVDNIAGFPPSKVAVKHVLIVTDLLCGTRWSVPSCVCVLRVRNCSHYSPNTVVWRYLSDSVVGVVHVNQQIRVDVVGWLIVGDHAAGDAQEPHHWKQMQRNKLFFVGNKIYSVLIYIKQRKEANPQIWNQKMSDDVFIIRDVYPSTSPKRTPSTARTWPGGSRFWATAWGWRDCRTSGTEYGRLCTD